MVQTITVDGEEYRVTGEPSMGTVKFVQQMEIEVMRRHLSDDALLQMEQSDDAMEDILEDANIEDFKEMMWDRSLQEPLQTICLGVDREFTIDEVEEMPALGFKELKEVSEEELGGTAQDFIEALGIGISSTVSELQDQIPESQTNSPEMPLTASGTSSEQ